ncbi:testis-specific Y-encoded protein 3-like isoform X1 [Sorex fumeus]|uniref:testis-specific Y-encoded protein 3-like isoform X1 n=2 Tax=Sorex fumeus TaxID=62283 RepID=UPI0024AD9709|nr:testis-specific Y-encoded protein 3-like isoform X1 [Sorex fumeus]
MAGAAEEPERRMITIQQPKEQPEAEQKEKPALGCLIQQPSLEALQSLQLELELVNKQSSRTFNSLKLKMSQRLLPILEHRSTIIQSIPGFWTKVLVNHRDMTVMISYQDQDLLGYMFNLQVDEQRYPNGCCKISLFFRMNIYFRNDVIVKEYVSGISGLRPSHSTPIQWCHGYEHRAYRHRHHNCSLNFFSWFYDHSIVGSTRIAEIISKDLWPKPLQYYLKKRIPVQASVRRAAVENVRGYVRR